MNEPVAWRKWNAYHQLWELTARSHASEETMRAEGWEPLYIPEEPPAKPFECRSREIFMTGIITQLLVNQEEREPGNFHNLHVEGYPDPGATNIISFEIPDGLTYRITVEETGWQNSIVDRPDP